MELSVIGPDQKTSRMKVPEVFAGKYNEALVHQVVTAYLAGGRSGSKAQKNRAAVQGGGCKPWRQKGTGRARAGTIRSPLWRSGGVTFAASPRSFAQKVNRKMYRSAMQAIMAELIRQKRLVIVKSLSIKQPKTRELAAELKTLEMSKGLIVLAEADASVTLAARNIPQLEVLTAATLNPVSLVAADKVLITVAALKALQEKWV